MSTAELKIKLINQITVSDNQQLLSDLLRMINMEKDDLSIYPLSDQQLSLVRESLADVQAGNFLTEEEADKETDEWLGK